MATSSALGNKVSTAVGKAEIERYFKLDAERLSLARQVKDLAALQEKIEEKMIALVKAKGGKLRSVVRCGYLLSLSDKDGSVKWKDEFVRVAGSEAAEKLIRAAPKKETFSIEPEKK